MHLGADMSTDTHRKTSFGRRRKKQTNNKSKTKINKTFFCPGNFGQLATVRFTLSQFTHLNLTKMKEREKKTALY